MDVSPKTLREVEFREKMRGYHPEDVDQFLERVAAGIEVLQDRLRQAIERAQRAEQAATEAGGNDDALRRTLLLAQRTADLAVQEGREQAARIVAGAEQEAQSLVSESQQRSHAMVTDAEHRSQSMLADSERRAQSLVSDAEQQARRGHEDALVQVRAELAKLEVTRQRLQRDIDAMTRWVGEHRSQLRAALEDALSRVDQIDVAPPPAAGVPYMPESQPAPASSPGATASPAAMASHFGPPGAGLPSGEADPNAPWAPRPAASPAAPAPVTAATPAPSPYGAATPAPSAGPRQDALAWKPDESPAEGSDESGDSDPYFAELRRAISDRDPLGPAQEADPQAAPSGHGET